VMTNEQAIAFYGPEAQEVVRAFNESAITKGAHWDYELPMTTATGKSIWVRNRGEPVVRDGKVVLLTGTIQDITDRKLAELALLRRTRELEMHNSILRQIHQGTPLVEMLESMTRQIEALHPDMLCSILLLDHEGKHLHHAAAPSLPDFFNQAIDGVVIGDGVGCCGTAAFRGERVIAENLQNDSCWSGFLEVASRAKLHSCCAQPIKNHSGQVLGTFSIYRHQPGRPSDDDIVLIENYANLAELLIERHRAEEKIRSLAFCDTLTGLPNRRMLDDRLSLAMAVSKRSGRYGALMFLDLDHFKTLNDTQGHAVGDQLLVLVAQRISECVREADTVARFGGDEFVVMLSELDERKAESTAEAGRVAEKIRSILAQPYLLAGNHHEMIEYRCTASIGVALFINHEARLDDILKWADAGMYKAKDEGRNRVYFVD
jgi:diguanylate cyclase (GGDEF)-like protein